MSSLSVLTEVNRWVGVGIALFGAFFVAPAGTRVIRESIQAQSRKIRGWLARYLQFLRRPATGHAQGTSNLVGAAAGLSARGYVLPAWDPSARADERIEVLRQYIEQVKDRLSDVDQRLTQETQERKQADADIDQRITAELAELRRERDEREAQSAHIDARALPVIAIGIVLSGVPDRLAQFPSDLHVPFAFGWLIPIGCIVYAVWAYVRARRAHQATPK